MQIHIFLIEKCSSYNIIQDQIQLFNIYYICQIWLTFRNCRPKLIDEKAALRKTHRNAEIYFIIKLQIVVLQLLRFRCKYFPKNFRNFKVQLFLKNTSEQLFLFFYYQSNINSFQAVVVTTWKNSVRKSYVIFIYRVLSYGYIHPLNGQPSSCLSPAIVSLFFWVVFLHDPSYKHTNINSADVKIGPVNIGAMWL